MEIYQELQSLDLVIVEVSSEALDLAEAYVAHNILTPKYRNDALHIAVATITNVDVLVSWHFHHIVRFDKILRFNVVNLELGYKPIDIRSPQEVAGYGRKDD